jgi:peptidase E
MRVLLASRHLAGFVGAGRRAAVLPTAAEPLPDRDLIVRDLLADVGAAGCAPLLVDPGDPDALDDAEVIVVGGGDPYHLLDRLRATGCDARIRDAVDQGRLYVGISAGAIVAGPSLLPQTVVSPFPPPAGLDLQGLGLVDVVVFPHRERPGREARIAEAVARFGARFDLRPLGDRDVLVF